MSRLLKITAILELATGLALMGVPSSVAQLLLGTGLSGVDVVLARVAGIALIALGIACWPGRDSTRASSSAMLGYNLLVTVYFLYLGVRGEWVGILLWPAAGLHALLTTLLARERIAERKTRRRVDGGPGGE